MTGNTSLNKGGGAHLAVADAVLDVCFAMRAAVLTIVKKRHRAHFSQVIAEVPVGFEDGEGVRGAHAFDA